MRPVRLSGCHLRTRIGESPTSTRRLRRHRRRREVFRSRRIPPVHRLRRLARRPRCSRSRAAHAAGTGAGHGTRTRNLRFTRAVRYQLRQAGLGARASAHRGNYPTGNAAPSPPHLPSQKSTRTGSAPSRKSTRTGSAPEPGTTPRRPGAYGAGVPVGVGVALGVADGVGVDPLEGDGVAVAVEYASP